MISFFAKGLSVLAMAFPFGKGAACNSSSDVVAIPDPKIDNPLAAARGKETAVVAGGCFWGIQAVFEHLKGVIHATSGYSGGAANTATYEKVCSGRTGHAEAVEVVFDPSEISYGQVLKILFSVAHDPTELNRQGPDVGTQYRSAIFYASDDQKRIAEAYVKQLDDAKVFPKPIMTQIVPLDDFYPAEEYHQGYAETHPENMYIVINDLPKVANLKKQYPSLFVEKK
ncbi:MAG: peptide-methionine (S)-S-oxide reductase MsrA [Acidobacteriia bacterium]|nr:peptide-methionine (S)-S-oxide reductase MsrA [Terriglobia bacterium]